MKIASFTSPPPPSVLFFPHIGRPSSALFSRGAVCFFPDVLPTPESFTQVLAPASFSSRCFRFQNAPPAVVVLFFDEDDD